MNSNAISICNINIIFNKQSINWTPQLEILKFRFIGSAALSQASQEEILDS